MINQKIRLVALDLDHTTLANNGTLPEENRQALIDAINHGVEVVVASGRPFTALPKEVLEIPGIRYAVTSNGCAVNSISTGKRLREVYLSKESIDGILRETEGWTVYFECFIQGNAFAEKKFLDDPAGHGSTDRAVAYLQSTRKPVVDMRAFIKENAGSIEAIDIVTMNEEDMRYLWSHLEKTVPDLFVTSSIRQLIEISSCESSKSRGVKFVLDHLGIPLEEAAAFGDGENDADMLKAVGYGVAVENATSTCLAAADYVTKSNDDCGVAYAFRHILKIID